MKDNIKKPSMLQRGIQIILGVLCLPFCLFFIIASISLLIPDTNLSWQAELFKYMFGLIALFGSIWFSVLAICLILNKQYPKIPDVQLPPWPMMYIPHEYLTAKIRLFGSQMIFFEEGKYIAEYDIVHQDLSFNDGKSFLFNESPPERVKDTVFPKGTAQIACIVDLHYTVVPDEASGSDMSFYIDNGEIIYYKEGEPEVVAHSERTFSGHSEIIVCNKKEYRVVRTEKLCSGVAELYENDHSIATISTGFFRQKSIFRNDLPLKDRIFISLLVYMNWPPYLNRTKSNFSYFS